MKTLYLLRHAKSSWKDPTLADHDRPLAPRGRRAARVMADHIVTIRPRPRLVLCSTARRARETCDLIVGGLVASVAVELDDELYGASDGELRVRLHQLPADADAVLVIGHNPALSELATQLAGDGDPTALSRLRDKFPTAALAPRSPPGRPGSICSPAARTWKGWLYRANSARDAATRTSRYAGSTLKRRGTPSSTPLPSSPRPVGDGPSNPSTVVRRLSNSDQTGDDLGSRTHLQ